MRIREVIILLTIIVITIIFMLGIIEANATSYDYQKDNLQSDTLKTELIPNIEKSAEIKCLLEGIWAERKDENAIFYIDSDSFYYVEDMENPIGMKIKQDSIFLNNGVNFEIVKLNNDSLWLKSEWLEGIWKLNRR